MKKCSRKQAVRRKRTQVNASGIRMISCFLRRIRSRAGWGEYVTELHNDNRNEDFILEDDEGEDILMKEVQAAIGALKKDKAAGLDQINTKVLKAVDEMNLKILISFVTSCINKEEYHEI